MAKNILGSVSEDRDMKTLTSIFRKASLKVHPDKHQGSEEEIAKYTEIFKILTNKYEEAKNSF